MFEVQQVRNRNGMGNGIKVVEKTLANHNRLRLSYSLGREKKIKSTSKMAKN